MTHRAAGTFDVKLALLEGYTKDPMFSRRSLDKVFHGDLEGTSQGEMLSAGTRVTGSAAYVAIERISATLAGRTGSFACHHVGVMTRGAPNLSISIVPDSGEGGLTGITGTMSIEIVDGKHFYELHYELPAQ